MEGPSALVPAPWVNATPRDPGHLDLEEPIEDSGKERQSLEQDISNLKMLMNHQRFY